jgi:isoamylase
VRNMLTTLLFAQGTPMVLAGDEFGRTQHGSNNAYCQDNEISWVDWESAGREAPLTEFVRRLVALRREVPLLRQRRFLNGEILNGSGKKDVTWLLPSGSEITQDEWRDDQLRCFGMLLYGESRECLLVMNAGDEDVPWTLPALDVERAWFACLDTSQPTVAEPTICPDPTLTVKNRSFVLLEARTTL